MNDAKKRDGKNGRKVWIVRGTCTRFFCPIPLDNPPSQTQNHTDNALKVVRFYILQSPSDKNPTVLKSER
jgi:hypothetical protein